VNKVRSDLLEFIQLKLGNTNLQLTDLSPIEQTFGIAELDTIVFYTDFVKHFNLELPADWNISNHVSPVGCFNWRHYVKWLFSKKYRRNTRYYDLTIGDLETMIETRRWHFRACAV